MSSRSPGSRVLSPRNRTFTSSLMGAAVSGREVIKPKIPGSPYPVQERWGVRYGPKRLLRRKDPHCRQFPPHPIQVRAPGQSGQIGNRPLNQRAVEAIETDQSAFRTDPEIAIRGLRDAVDCSSEESLVLSPGVPYVRTATSSYSGPAPMHYLTGKSRPSTPVSITEIAVPERSDYGRYSNFSMTTSTGCCSELPE